MNFNGLKFSHIVVKSIIFRTVFIFHFFSSHFYIYMSYTHAQIAISECVLYGLNGSCGLTSYSNAILHCGEYTHSV